MLTWPSGVRLYLASAPTDLRKGFDGLAALVQGEFGLDPMHDGLFIFLNRKMTQMRCLFWDRDGYCVLAKRLEQGTFRRIRSSQESACIEIDVGELAMLLEGIDARQVRRRKRYCAAPRSAAAWALQTQRGGSMNAATHERGYGG